MIRNPEQCSMYIGCTFHHQWQITPPPDITVKEMIIYTSPLERAFHRSSSRLYMCIYITHMYVAINALCMTCHYAVTSLDILTSNSVSYPPIVAPYIAVIVLTWTFLLTTSYAYINKAQFPYIHTSALIHVCIFIALRWQPKQHVVDINDRWRSSTRYM